MGEVDFRGPEALRAIQTLVTNDASKLADGQALYTMLCHDNGGIVDDCIVYRFGPEHFRIVVNAANIAKDVAHFHRHADSICEVVDRSDEFALLAVQGPKAVAMVAELGGASLADVPSFSMGTGKIAGVEITAARTGYTGEDGFELFVPASSAAPVYKAVLDAGAAPIGLGARDTLRLEARLSLYGNDLTDDTNPIEAGLSWTVKLGKDVDFIGKAALQAIKDAGPKRKLVGFVVESRGIARPGAEVLGDDGSVVGTVTSGGPAPAVGGAIGLAYVPAEMAGPDKPLTLRQRGRELQAKQVKGPFYRRGA
jgi:aminomethyltransferase